jgi:hypothetical protein
MLCLLAVLVILMGGFDSGHWSAETSMLRIARVVKPPRLEQFIDGSNEPQEGRVTEFKQREPGDGVAASEATTAYVSYDDTHLHVVFVCKARPGTLRAHMSRRDAIGEDDQVGIVIDTFHTHRWGYVFFVNPLGVQNDGITSEESEVERDDTFDTLWHSDGRLTADGFAVRLAIPFKSLRFPNLPVQSWGIALGRWIPSKGELSMWPLLSKRVASFHQQMATLDGLERVSPGRNVQVTPYGTFSTARVRMASGAPERQNERRAGIDAKVVLRDAVTLDATVKPDFSQVEADEPQQVVNQRFEVEFPEKRPFFLENARFFATPQELFFSRRIADPEVGMRATGKMSGWTFGALAVADRGSSRQETPTSQVGSAVVLGTRLQREFAEQSSLGLFITRRQQGDLANRVLAIDTRLGLGPTWILRAQAIASTTRDSNRERWGSGYYAELRRSGLHFNYLATYLDRSPGFRADLGFIPRVDVRQTEQVLKYSWYPARGRIVSLTPSALVALNWNRKGHLQERLINPGFAVELPRHTIVETALNEGLELYRGTTFTTRSARVTVQSEALNWLDFAVTWTLGSNVNHFPAGEMPPAIGDEVTTDARLTFRPTPPIRIEGLYLYSRLREQQGQRDIFSSRVFRLKASYQFTRELGLRTIVDHNVVQAGRALVLLEPGKRIILDVLLTYLLNPGTALYAGYGARHNTLDDGGQQLGEAVGTAAPLTAASRQLFVKVSYLLRF